MVRSLWVICVTALCVPAWAGSADQAAAAVNRLADRYYDLVLGRTPEIAYFAGVEIARHDGISDNSPDARVQAEREDDALLAELDAIDSALLVGRVEWITHGILEQALESSRDLRICRWPFWNVNQMDGWQLNYVLIADLQPVGSDELREQALARFGRLPAYIDQDIANLERGLESGYSAPKAVVRRVIAQVDKLWQMPDAESPFLSPARRDETPGFAAALEKLTAEQILPALKRYRDFLADTYLEVAREELSVAANPDGKQCYEASLRSYTTLERSGEEVYALGRSTVEANRQRVIELGEAEYGLADFGEIIAHIKSDKSDVFETKEEMLQFARAAVSRAEGRLDQWFGMKPSRPVIVEPYPDYQEGSGVSSRYEPGSKDRPGVYRINREQPEKSSRGAAEIVAFHEAYPGHHTQIAIAQDRNDLHRITKLVFYSGFGEGWARYSEALAEEMGLYQTTTGPISRRAWPARGMVVDPGLHLMGWSREKARAFMAESGRFTPEQLDQMVDRIAILPGQLTSYDSGGLEIIALRRAAEAALGDDFDIREFHDRVLENGTVPLGLLRRHIETWLNETQRAAGLGR